MYIKRSMSRNLYCKRMHVLLLLALFIVDFLAIGYVSSTTAMILTSNQGHFISKINILSAFCFVLFNTTINLISKNICSGLPILPVSTAEHGTWPLPLTSHLYYGDIRAVINISQSSSYSIVKLQIFWRRRDANPSVRYCLCFYCFYVLLLFY